MRVVFTPEAEFALAELEQYIAEQGAPLAAERFITAILDFCEGLTTFPDSGIERNDILPGLRLAHYRKRVVIAYRVSGKDLIILGAYYGGQDFEELLRDAN